jgi:hypothetical protein
MWMAAWSQPNDLGFDVLVGAAANSGVAVVVVVWLLNPFCCNRPACWLKPLSLTNCSCCIQRRQSTAAIGAFAAIALQWQRRLRCRLLLPWCRRLWRLLPLL